MEKGTGSDEHFENARVTVCRRRYERVCDIDAVEIEAGIGGDEQLDRAHMTAGRGTPECPTLPFRLGNRLLR
jgi:hypothetical protein